MSVRQEAILAAISEKDAHIAVLEMAPNKKTENIEEVEKLTKEKLRLQQVLKDLVSEHHDISVSSGSVSSVTFILICVLVLVFQLVLVSFQFYQTC